MLKNTNFILWVMIVMGVVLASYTTTQSSSTAEVIKEKPDLFPTQIPGAEEDEVYDIEDIMGSIQDSTDQEQE